MKERRDAGKPRCRIGWIQERRDARDEGCKFGSEMALNKKRIILILNFSDTIAFTDSIDTHFTSSATLIRDHVQFKNMQEFNFRIKVKYAAVQFEVLWE